MKKYVAAIRDIIVVLHAPQVFFFNWTVEIYIHTDEHGWKRWDFVPRLASVDGETVDEGQFPKEELDKVRSAAISRVEKSIPHVFSDSMQKTDMPCH